MILTGKSSMAMNDTAVFDFDADFTMMRADDQHEHARLRYCRQSDANSNGETQIMARQLDMI
jgi:hypothetical protein